MPDEEEFIPNPLPLLEDLEIDDLVRHLEENGAAVRVPEERITLLDEVVPDIRLIVEDQVRPLSWFVWNTSVTF